MPVIETNGINIYYETKGSGSPLMLINGWGGNLDSWSSRMVGLLAEKHHVIMMDNRGTGRSDKPDIPYTMDMMAADTRGVLEALGIEKAHIMGFSMGGAITQELVLNFPERVQSIALISTWPKFNNYAKTVYENLKKLRVTSKPEDFMELLQLSDT